jgi:hypothetical protein
MRIGKTTICNLLFIGGLCGCMSSLDYTPAPEGAIKYGSGDKAVPVDAYRVNEDSYAKYKLAGEEFYPPPATLCGFGGCNDMPTNKLRKKDVWKVKHVFKGYHLIQSDSYNERLCRSLDRKGYGNWFVNILNKCRRGYDFAIYIDPDGVIMAGWELLPGVRKVGAERKVYLNPSPSKKTGWPEGVVFQAID